SLSDFINWVEQYGANIKIKETQFEGVRVMTIHKAKGLEFEIVIIPETNWSPGPESELIFSYSKKAKPEKIFLRKYGKFLPGLIEKEKELCLVDEFNVLYVALTRARSGVWMLGYKRKKGNSGLWFETIKEKLGDSPLPYDRIPKKEASKMVKERGEKVHKVSSEKVSVVKEERELYSPTERGIEIIEPARRAGMKFGDLVHKVLSRVEWLDNLKIDDFADELLRYVKNNFVRTKDEREEVDKRLKPLLLEIFNDQDLRFIFYKDNRNIEYKNELPIYFEDGKKDVSVHIDRVLIEPDRIIIIDFKTGKEKAEYVHQMNVYKKGVELIYPGQKVNTILVYLENQAGNRIKSI
ncbi:MAG: 3'-5' exonuclease, partial [candidate division WOR-3 bacterium]